MGVCDREDELVAADEETKKPVNLMCAGKGDNRPQVQKLSSFSPYCRPGDPNIWMTDNEDSAKV